MKNITASIFTILFVCLLAITTNLTAQDKYEYTGETMRVGVIGLEHDHVGQILGRENYGDIEIVGIVEPNHELAERYCTRFGISMDIVYDDLEEMLAAQKPEAVCAFNRISEHITVVQACAPKGIHVMVEKPLATNYKDAEKMIALAEKNHIQLLTNYETTWYGSNAAAFKIANIDKSIGDIRKIVFRTGHQGPVEIGCTKEFLAWLTDPVLNGAGALNDFGCYGANISTWLMQGATPTTVSCVTQTIKPDVYPKVDDEATIVLTYPQAQVIIQASWNWPYNRKDMQLYGRTGYVLCNNGQDMVIMQDHQQGQNAETAAPLQNGLHDPFAYFTSVVKGGYQMEPFAPSSLENNKIAMQILDAAKASATTHRTIVWDKYFKN